MKEYQKYINKSRKGVTQRGDIIFYLLMLAIPLVQIGIFYFGVNTQSIAMSFQVYNTVENQLT